VEVSVKFKDVAQTFDLIERESSRTKITVILAELFKKATPHEASLIAYLSLGNIYPEYKGIQFNLAEKSLIKIISVLLDKSPDFVQKKLTELGDLGLVVQQEYNNKNSGSQNKTLGEVYNNLEEIIFITGTGSQERKEEKILELLRELDPVSVKYIVRIIIGTLRMGFSDMTLLDAFSWMERWDKSLREPLEEAYNISVDIGLLIRVLKDSGLAGIKKMSITPGVPIRPAAAERLESAHAIVDKLGSCIAQPKLDGFRLQVHIDRTDKKNPLVRFFSRNLQDMSAMFPDLYQAVLELDVKTLVA
jgi:DNA ligase-1